MFHETSLNCLMLCFCCCFLKRGRDRRLERQLSLINRLRTCNYLFSFHFFKERCFCRWSKRLIPGSENRGIHISNRVWQRYSPHSKTAYVFHTLQAQILCQSRPAYARPARTCSSAGSPLPKIRRLRNPQEKYS